MKEFSLSSFVPSAAKNIYAPQLFKRLANTSISLFYLGVLLTALLFTSCKKHDKDECKGLDSYKEFAGSVKGFSQKTLCELQQAREATEKYRDFKKAIDDGYADISVVLPNIGYHYMKASLSDAKFEISRPEILVYNKNHEDVSELVADKYAVPIVLTPNNAPESFTGPADVWDCNTGFGLWLLHA